MEGYCGKSIKSFGESREVKILGIEWVSGGWY